MKYLANLIPKRIAFDYPPGTFDGGAFRRYDNVAAYSLSNPSVVGAIVFEISGGFNYFMQSHEIVGYNYTYNDGGWSALVSFYAYGSAPFVAAPTVSYQGSGTYGRPQIRIGRRIATGNPVIIIGDITSSWSYPQLQIARSWVGFGAATDTQVDGATSTLATSLAAYDSIAAATNVSGSGVGSTHDALLMHLAGTETISGDKTFNNVAIATLTLTNPVPQSKSHASPDTDVAATSLHHTLGTGAFQAAAGNHTHDASGVVSGVLALARLPVAASGTSSASMVVRADDARLSDARTPSNDAALVHLAGAETISGTKTFSAVTIATLTLTNALAQSSTHASPDTDASATALHHTLGTGAFQAAAGNHTHDASGVVSGLLALARLPVAPSGTSSATQVVRADDARLSDARTPSNDALLMHLAGTEGVSGAKTFSAALTTFNSEIVSDGGPNSTAQFRAKPTNSAGTHPAALLIRNDGSSTYFLLTDDATPDGSWSSTKSYPLIIDNNTGLALLHANDVQVNGSSLSRGAQSGSAGAAKITASSTVNANTTLVAVPGLSVTVTVPAGRRLKISFNGHTYTSVAGDRAMVAIMEDATQLATLYSPPMVVAGSVYLVSGFSYVDSPSAGSHTYSISLQRYGAGSGNENIYGSAGAPASLLVEDIGPA
jgi:hypothetical protein